MRRGIFKLESSSTARQQTLEGLQEFYSEVGERELQEFGQHRQSSKTLHDAGDLPELRYEQPSAVFLVDADQLTHEQARRINSIKAFIAGLSEVFRREFHLELHELLLNKKPEFKRRLLDLIEKYNLDQPRFWVYDAQEANIACHKWANFSEKQEYLREIRIKPGNFMVVFDFPKQIAKLWQKEGSTSDSDIVFWGNLYRSLLPVVWDMRDNSMHPRLLRLNNFLEHCPGEYYYIWEAE